jgi:hypothetical protein
MDRELSSLSNLSRRFGPSKLGLIATTAEIESPSWQERPIIPLHSSALQLCRRLPNSEQHVMM